MTKVFKQLHEQDVTRVQFISVLKKKPNEQFEQL